jgi:curved DNA-binding protein CbpA
MGGKEESVHSTNDYYHILQITPTETLSGIHRAYRRLAKQHHPDHAGVQGAAAFRAIQEAYQVLSNPERKRRYDETLRVRRERIHITAEPLIKQDRHAPRAEPLVDSPSGMDGGGSRIFEETCRAEVYKFVRLAERLLSPLILASPLTEDELWLIRQYLRELTNRYGM